MFSSKSTEIGNTRHPAPTIAQSQFVGDGADFSNVRVKVTVDANVSNVEYGREN